MASGPSRSAAGQRTGRPRRRPPGHRLRLRESAIRFFASSHSVDQLAPRTRVLVALMLLCFLFQLASGIAMHHAGPGWSMAAIAAHYGAPAAAAQAPVGIGLAPPLPPPATDIPAASLVELAHIHLAMMPLVVFVVAHVFAMTGLGRLPAAGWIGYATFAAVLADVGAPFLVRGHSAAWAPLKLGAFLVLAAGLGFMLCWCLGALLASFSRSGSAPRPDRR